MHRVGVFDQKVIEATNPAFILEELQRAQERSWSALQEIRRRLKIGMSELDAIHLATQTLVELGSERSWHRPLVRFGENTSKPYSAQPEEKRVLRGDDICLIDLGPTWMGKDGIEYEGDVGETFSLSGSEAHLFCISSAKEIFQKGCAFWRETHCSGEQLYKFLSREAERLDLELVTEDDGHRIGDFPHKRTFSGSLSAVDFTPSVGLWVLEVHLRERQGRHGAFFEDLLR